MPYVVRLIERQSFTGLDMRTRLQNELNSTTLLGESEPLLIVSDPDGLFVVFETEAPIEEAAE